MKCSKCKIFSVHLPNFDSYICESGHVFCRSCSPKPYSRCNICDGRIVRRTELLIEGVPKTIFHHTEHDDSNQISEVDCDMKLNMDSDSDENWSQIFDYRHFEEFPRHTESPRHYACEMLGQRVSPRVLSSGSPRKIPSNHEPRGDYNDSIRHRRSVCHFKTPSNESIKIEDTVVNHDDPKNLYKKAIAGDVALDFDPMKDYYERIAQVNTIHEYYKRPNLVIATKSSSKIDIKMADENMSDSSTIIQHLSEFRKATNYVPSSNLDICKVDGVETTSEPTMITTSKTRIPTRIPPVSQPSKSNNSSYLVKEPDVHVLYAESAKSVKRKIDVGTMMDFCLTASTNTPDKSSKEHEDEIKRNPQMCNSDDEENLLSGPKSTLRKTTNNSLNTCSPSLRTLLREQLKNQVYSHFDRAPKKPQNVFMVKGFLTSSEMLPHHSTEVTAIPKVTTLSDAINCEVEKALKNLTTLPKLQCNGSQRRDEIVKQSKNLLRQRILDEIYSHFEKNSIVKQSEPSDLEILQKESQTRQFKKKREAATEKENSESKLDDYPVEAVNNQSACDDTEIVDVESPLLIKGNRTVGMSTESYPKLNPDLNIILPSKVFTQKSDSLYCPEEQTYEYTQKFESSYISNPNIYHAPSMEANAESDGVKEILEQFQKNISLESNQNGMLQTQHDVDLTQYEEVLKVDSLSSNVQGNCGNNSNRSSKEPESLTNQENVKIYENFLLPISENQRLGDNFMRAEQIHQNVYLFQQQQHMYSPLISPPKHLITLIGDDCANKAMKTMAKTLVEDFREEPINAVNGGILDVNKFIQYIKDKFPAITLKQLKQIILNLPTNEIETDEMREIAKRFPSPAAFRSDYDKCGVQPDISDRQTTDQATTEFESSDYPAELTLGTIVTAWRAHFSPSIDLYVEPIPQLKPISRFDTEVSLVDNVFRGVKAAAELNLSRNPITCPMTTCSKLIFVSEFSKHIKMDHVKIPVETLTPGRCKNLFLDPKSDEYGVNKCHVLYLVTDKIRDLGSKEFKDYLPLLVMATKVSLLQLISPLHQGRSELAQSSQQNYLMIWLTGLSPQDLPIYFSLTAWHRFSTIPKCHIVHSGRIYSIRNKHDERSVYNSGNAMLLSQNQVQLLTNNGQDMIELQIIVH